MISTPNSTGRATSTAAWTSIWWRPSRDCRTSGGTPCLRRTRFSAITTAPSTIRPKSIAPSDMRFADTPVRRIPMKPLSIARGMTPATMSAARKLRRNTNRTATTSAEPSSRFVATVREVRAMTSLWS